MQKTNVLVIHSTNFFSGAEYSLFDLIIRTQHNYNYVIAQPFKSEISTKDLNVPIEYVPLIWFYKTRNPIQYIRFFVFYVLTLRKLYRIIKDRKIQIIYTNTFKSAIYGSVLQLLTRKKLVCHIRDNLLSSRLEKSILNRSHVNIVISDFLVNQLSGFSKNCRLIYGGVDANEWQAQLSLRSPKENFFDLPARTGKIIIACIGQITRWKNFGHFISLAKYVSSVRKDIQFLIIGDDLSGREKNYKNELLEFAKTQNLQANLHFLGHRHNIEEVIENIDILIHPAMNEPFGRVIIEAMAMEKPVVAYNCGGPAEIIEDDETGFLVEPRNFHQLAEKTLELIENSKMRITMGKAGRKRVVEKFNINRYVREMEELFDSVLNES